MAVGYTLLLYYDQSFVESQLVVENACDEGVVVKLTTIKRATSYGWF